MRTGSQPSAVTIIEFRTLTTFGTEREPCPAALGCVDDAWVSFSELVQWGRHVLSR